MLQAYLVGNADANQKLCGVRSWGRDRVPKFGLKPKTFKKSIRFCVNISIALYIGQYLTGGGRGGRGGRGGSFYEFRGRIKVLKISVGYFRHNFDYI